MSQGRRGVPARMMQSAPSTWVGRTALLAALYFLSGKLGLLLALPPGYATGTGPPRHRPRDAHRFRVAALARRVGRLVPPERLQLGGLFPEQGLLLSKVLAALGIAAGSTLQSMVGRALIARYWPAAAVESTGRPVRLFTLAGPVACCVGSTVGVSTLYSCGLLVPQNILVTGLPGGAGIPSASSSSALVLAAAGSHARLVGATGPWMGCRSWRCWRWSPRSASPSTPGSSPRRVSERRSRCVRGVGTQNEVALEAPPRFVRSRSAGCGRVLPRIG